MLDRSREHAVLVACAGGHPPAALLEELRAAGGGIDWDYLAAAAAAHASLPGVCANLRRAGFDLPQPAASWWDGLQANTTRDNLTLMSQLVRLVQLLQAHGIPAVTWKGPVFAHTGYGSLS